MDIDDPKVMSPGKRTMESPDTQTKRQKLTTSGDFMMTENSETIDEESKCETIPQLFSTLSAFVPEWVWISWVTDLLSGLDQPHGRIYKVQIIIFFFSFQ